MGIPMEVKCTICNKMVYWRLLDFKDRCKAFRNYQRCRYYDDKTYIRRVHGQKRSLPQLARRLAVAKAKAKRKLAEGRYTADDIMKIREKQHDKCNYCGIPLDGKGEIDHIIPLVKGGTNWPNNLQLLCRRHNRIKRSAILPQHKALYAHRMTQIEAKNVLQNRKNAT